MLREFLSAVSLIFCTFATRLRFSQLKKKTFELGHEVIRGWDLGVLTMTKGEGSRFTLASEMGYGPGGFPAWGIPPHATLVFDIEVLNINGM